MNSLVVTGKEGMSLTVRPPQKDNERGAAVVVELRLEQTEGPRVRLAFSLDAEYADALGVTALALARDAAPVSETRKPWWRFW